MWGSSPASAALVSAKAFDKAGFRKILIPGIGYGRNAEPFLEKGMEVTGIEISGTAVALAKGHYHESLKIYHGSVADMPFDDNRYDGIFAHALINLLDQDERAKLIADCYNQLGEKGLMIFTAITKQASTYGYGNPAGKDRFEQFGGVKIFFYDLNSIQKEFKAFGLIAVQEIWENYPFYLIQCKK